MNRPEARELALAVDQARRARLAAAAASRQTPTPSVPRLLRQRHLRPVERADIRDTPCYGCVYCGSTRLAAYRPQVCLDHVAMPVLDPYYGLGGLVAYWQGTRAAG